MISYDVMADRGFNVSDKLAMRGAHLEVPAYTKEKQLSGMEVERSRQLAHVRIHVESYRPIKKEV